MEQEQKEEWRPVVGFEGYYEVSSFGRVRRVQTGHVLKPTLTKVDKKYAVWLEVSGKRRGSTVAHLVAEAFLGAPPEKHMNVFHKDNDGFNNKPDNLYWAKFGFSREAIEHSVATRRTADFRAKIAAASRKRLENPTHYENFCKPKKVICLETGVIYPSQTAASIAFGLCKDSVHASCSRGSPKNWQLYNRSGKALFHFRYYNPEDWKPKERIWRPVVGFEGKYEVSNLGEVRTVRTNSFRSTYRATHGRTIIVNLYEANNKVKYVSVAKLVAEAFLHRVYGATAVCHLDGDLSNNCVTNLYWSDRSELLCNPVAHHDYMQARPKRPVVCVETGKRYDSIKEAAEACKMRPTAIQMSCCMKRSRLNKTINGKQILHFRYADH